MLQFTATKTGLLLVPGAMASAAAIFALAGADQDFLAATTDRHAAASSPSA